MASAEQKREIAETSQVDLKGVTRLSDIVYDELQLSRQIVCSKCVDVVYENKNVCERGHGFCGEHKSHEQCQACRFKCGVCRKWIRSDIAPCVGGRHMVCRTHSADECRACTNCPICQRTLDSKHYCYHETEQGKLHAHCEKCGHKRLAKCPLCREQLPERKAPVTDGGTRRFENVVINVAPTPPTSGIIDAVPSMERVVPALYSFLPTPPILINPPSLTPSSSPPVSRSSPALLTLPTPVTSMRRSSDSGDSLPIYPVPPSTPSSPSLVTSMRRASDSGSSLGSEDPEDVEAIDPLYASEVIRFEHPNYAPTFSAFDGRDLYINPNNMEIMSMPHIRHMWIVIWLALVGLPIDWFCIPVYTGHPLLAAAISFWAQYNWKDTNLRWHDVSERLRECSAHVKFTCTRLNVHATQLQLVTSAFYWNQEMYLPLHSLVVHLRMVYSPFKFRLLSLLVLGFIVFGIYIFSIILNPIILIVNVVYLYLINLESTLLYLVQWLTEFLTLFIGVQLQPLNPSSWLAIVSFIEVNIGLLLFLFCYRLFVKCFMRLL